MRQSESALYTSTGLYIWLRRARLWNWFFVLAPIVLGAAAGLVFLENTAWAVLLSFAAGLFPAMREALKLDIHLDQIKDRAADYKFLQDAFRQLALIVVPAGNDEVSTKRMEVLMERLDSARSHSITIPEWAFKEAQEKVDSGDYDFQIDKNKRPKLPRTVS